MSPSSRGHSSTHCCHTSACPHLGWQGHPSSVCCPQEGTWTEEFVLLLWDQMPPGEVMYGADWSLWVDTWLAGSFPLGERFMRPRKDSIICWKDPQGSERAVIFRVPVYDTGRLWIKISKGKRRNQVWATRCPFPVELHRVWWILPMIMCNHICTVTLTKDSHLSPGAQGLHSQSSQHCYWQQLYDWPAIQSSLCGGKNRHVP